MAELPNQSSDLLFAWLSPIESKVDRRLHPKSTSLHIPASSPLVTKARSALRRTVRASHGNSFKNSERKSKGAVYKTNPGKLKHQARLATALV